MSRKKSPASVGKIQNRILQIRGARVIIDADLAEAYGVNTRRLNEQVRRNRSRFPKDFMFQLTLEEKRQVVANCDHLEKLKFSRSLPLAFTEHGAIMAASVLSSTKAVEMSVFVVRAFVQLRQAVSRYHKINQKLNQLEQRLSEHDEQLMLLLEAIRQLMTPDKPPATRRIGFRSRSDSS